jgi:hypothetical protein
VNPPKNSGTGNGLPHYARAQAAPPVASTQQGGGQSATNGNSDQLFRFAFRDHQR